MVSYAGFYVAPEDWLDWVRARCDPGSPPGVGNAKLLIEEALRKQSVEKYFTVTMVPIPPSEPEGCGGFTVMIYRLYSEERKYIAPRARVDSNGPEAMKRLIGLKVFEWRTIWYKEKSRDPPYEAEFLRPKPTGTKNKKRSDGTQKKGTETKKELDDDQKEKVDADQKGRTRVRFVDEVQGE